MRVLLAVDGSACSDMAVQAVIDGFRPDATQVRVLHAVEWMREMPLCFQYAHGPKAGDDVVECRNKSFDRARWSNGLRRSSSSRASIRACRHPMRTRAMALSRRLASGRPNLSSWDRTGGGDGPPATGKCGRVGRSTRTLLGPRRPDACRRRKTRGITIAACLGLKGILHTLPETPN